MELRPGYKQTEVGIIPEDWDVCDLGAVSSKITDGDHLTPKREREGNYLLSARNIRDSYIDLNDVDYVGDEEYKRMRQRCAPEVGDILISCSGHGLGRASTVPEGLRCVLVRSAALVKLNSRKADGLFIQYWLQSADAQSQISSSKSLAAQPNLFINSIERLRCLLPATVSEQRTIATALSDVDALLATLDRLIAKKRDLKQAAMQQLLTCQTRLSGFTGEWVVKPLGEVADVQKGQLITEKDAKPGNIPVIAGGKKPAYFHNVPNRRGKTITISGSGASAGYVAFFDRDIFASDCSTISESQDYSIEFLFFALQARQNAIYKAQTGGAQPHIHPSDIRPIMINVPKLAEQTAIAAVLKDMDEELALLEQRLVKTRALKKGMMQELLSGKTRLVFPKESHA